MSHFISVVIPCYNASNTLIRVFNSLLMQSYSNWEAIFVDDGSTDNTQQLIKKFIGKNTDRQIHYYNQNLSDSLHNRRPWLSLKAKKQIFFSYYFIFKLN